MQVVWKHNKNIFCWLSDMCNIKSCDLVINVYVWNIEKSLSTHEQVDMYQRASDNLEENYVDQNLEKLLSKDFSSPYYVEFILWGRR